MSRRDGPNAFVVYEFLPEQLKKRGIGHYEYLMKQSAVAFL